MGADFSVKRGNDYYRVRDVIGSDFIILVGKDPVDISTREGTVPLRVQPSLKMTQTSALFSDLKGERGYTPEHDPVFLFTRQTAHQESMAQQAAFSENTAQYLALKFQFELQSGFTVGNAIIGSPGGNGNFGGASKPDPHGSGELGSPAGIAPYNSMQALVTRDLQQNVNNAYGAESKPMDNLGDPIGHDQFDAMEFNFELSSEKNLNNPFIVIVTRFKEKETPQGYARNHIYAQSLDPISEKPQKIHIIAGGFPPAFTFIDYQMHLYNEGEEVASNVAKNRVEMTDDDAFEYLKVEYLDSHKGATLDPAPLMGHLPPDLRLRLPKDAYTQTFYVRVTKDGLAGETFLDRACTQPVNDSYLESVVHDLRFKPALKAGRPVEGVTPLTLNRLSI